MTKSELIKTLEMYPDNIEIKIGVNSIAYDITECMEFTDIDTNTKYIALRNEENEVGYIRRIMNRKINVTLSAT